MAAKTLLQLAREAEHRFWPKVDKRGPDECWPWLGTKNALGYGRLRVGSLVDGSRRMEKAHRISWALANNSDPGDLFICHHCDDPPCCNPQHLFPGDANANVKDMLRKGRGAVGERKGPAALTADVVIRLRELYAAGHSLEECGRIVGVPWEGAAYFAIVGRTWKHVGGPVTTPAERRRRMAPTKEDHR